MTVDVSVIGVILAALSAMIIGAIWYSKALFGKPWMKIIGLSDAQMKKKMGPVFGGLILVSLITAYAMSYFLAYTQNYLGGSWFAAGIVASLIAWAGFAATAIFAHGLFEPRDYKVLLINSGNRLVTLFAMAMILAAFMK